MLQELENLRLSIKKLNKISYRVIDILEYDDHWELSDEYVNSVASMIETFTKLEKVYSDKLDTDLKESKNLVANMFKGLVDKNEKLKEDN